VHYPSAQADITFPLQRFESPGRTIIRGRNVAHFCEIGRGM